MAIEPKKTRGRQKIEMKKIESEEEKLITFSKRRSGIYKKASELVTLTGVQVAFVVFSPSGKPFSFAHPTLDIVTNRFLDREEVTHPLMEAHRQYRINRLNQEHNELIDVLDKEKEKEKQLKTRMIDRRPKGWWDTPIEEFNLQNLIKTEDNYKKIQEKVHAKIREKGNVASCASSQPPPSATFIDPISQLDNPFEFNNMDPNANNVIPYFPSHDQFNNERN